MESAWARQRGSYDVQPIKGIHSSTYLLRQSLHDDLESDLVDERLGNGLSEDHLPAFLELVQSVGLFKFDLEGVERARELVRQERSGHSSLLQ